MKLDRGLLLLFTGVSVFIALVLLTIHHRDPSLSLLRFALCSPAGIGMHALISWLLYGYYSDLALDRNALRTERRPSKEIIQEYRERMWVSIKETAIYQLPFIACMWAAWGVSEIIK